MVVLAIEATNTRIPVGSCTLAFQYVSPPWGDPHWQLACEVCGKLVMQNRDLERLVKNLLALPGHMAFPLAYVPAGVSWYQKRYTPLPARDEHGAPVP